MFAADKAETKKAKKEAKAMQEAELDWIFRLADTDRSGYNDARARARVLDRRGSSVHSPLWD